MALLQAEDRKFLLKIFGLNLSNKGIVMSVLPSKKRQSATVDIMPTARSLYKNVLKLVLNKDVVPPQLNSEFRYPISNNVRDMCTNLAVALQCDAVKDHSRRSERFMSAHDCTVILDEHLTLLCSARHVDKKELLDILTDNVKVSRGIKQLMANDRIEIDRAHTNKRTKKEDSQKEVSKDDSSELVLPVASNDFSVTELKRKALEEAPELEGIINNPTDPDSPIIDKVRAIQDAKSRQAEEDIRRSRSLKSSK